VAMLAAVLDMLYLQGTLPGQALTGHKETEV
jgi:hypothetical protein